MWHLVLQAVKRVSEYVSYCLQLAIVTSLLSLVSDVDYAGAVGKVAAARSRGALARRRLERMKRHARGRAV